MGLCRYYPNIQGLDKESQSPSGIESDEKCKEQWERLLQIYQPQKKVLVKSSAF